MSQDQFYETLLSDEELARLCDVLIENHGPQIPKSGYSNRLPLSLEDVRGFEFICDSEIRSIIAVLIKVL